MADQDAFVIGGDVVRVTHAESITVFSDLVNVETGISAGTEGSWVTVPLGRMIRAEYRRLQWEREWWKKSNKTPPIDSLLDVAGALLHSQVRFVMRLYRGTQLLIWATPPYSDMRHLIVLDEALADGYLPNLAEVVADAVERGG